MSISNLEILQLAVESIELREDLPEERKTAAIQKLQAFGRRDWYHTWDRDSILQALHDYKARTGSAPTVTSLKEPGMPKSLTIKNTFHMDASAFLRKLFPELNQLRHCNPTYASPFGFQTKEDWLDCFRNQFQKHRKQITSGKKYNIVKDENTPTWGTICNHVGVGTWSELMVLADVSYLKRRKTAKDLKLVNVSNPYLDLLQKINETREEQLRRLTELLERHPVEPIPPQFLTRTEPEASPFTVTRTLPPSALQPAPSRRRKSPPPRELHLANAVTEGAERQETKND